MADKIVLTAPAKLPAGEVVATDVPAEIYLEQYAEHHYEWVRGNLIRMTPTSLQHNALVDYLRDLLRAYVDLKPIATVVGEPFVISLETTNTYRESDLQIILNTNPGNLTDTAMIGPADICIEVVSPESVRRDYGDKFAEYEQDVVQEYWLIDPQRQQARFHRLKANGVYDTISPDTDGIYQTPLLPGLQVEVVTLWRDPLPGFFKIAEQVKAMLSYES